MYQHPDSARADSGRVTAQGNVVTKSLGSKHPLKVFPTSPYYENSKHISNLNNVK